MTFQELVQKIKQAEPEARLELTELPSGALDLSIRIRGRFFVVQCAVGKDYGVSEVLREDDGIGGHAEVATQVEEVWELLKALMTNKGFKRYLAMIWTEDPTVPGRRVEVLATSLDDAQKQLEEQFGKSTVFDLHVEDREQPIR